FADLCRQGYHVCAASDDLSPAASTSGSARCNAAGGFYTTQIDIALRNVDTDHTADGRCTPQPGDQPHALLGCGTESGLYRLNSSGCNNLRTALDCAAAPTGWICTSAKDIVTHTSSAGGLLCCVNK